jgi:hypothetical protein
MAKAKLPQSDHKPEPKAKYDYGLTQSQLRVLSNIGDAVDGLSTALSSEDPDAGRINPEREVFASMALAIYGAIAPLFNAIERQKLGGAPVEAH